MASAHHVPLTSLRALRGKEWLCWLLAAVCGSTVAALFADVSLGGVIIPLLLAVFFGWSAWQLRQLHAFLSALGWDELRPRLAGLRGAAFDAAVLTLKAEMHAASDAPDATVSIDAEAVHPTAVIRVRPGLWVEIQARGTAVRTVRVTHGPDATPAGSPPAPSLHGAVALAALLVLFDGFVLDQGFFSLAIAASMILGRLPFALLSRHTALRRPRLRNLAIYLAAVAAVLTVKNLNNRLAHARADVLVAAVDAYHVKHARYPATLDQLVPEFADKIRPAKFTLGDSRFRYAADGGGALLYYTVLPPYGRRFYDFSNRSWSFRD